MAEPEWDVDTRALALADDDVLLCPACGRPEHICQDAERQFNWRVPAPVRCHASTALLAAQKRVTEETNPQHQALLWRVELAEEGVSGG